MASPIQNLISVGAAGAQPNLLASAASKGTQITNNLQNSGVQQIIATQAAQVINNPGKKRITDDKEVVDPSFDSDEKKAKQEEEENSEESGVTNPGNKRLLDVIA